MQQDPMEEWRRLTALYGEMGDLEIRELVDQINDLTPNAQQILRDELKKRGISGKSFASPARGDQDPDDFAAVHWDPREESIENMIGGAPEGGAAAYTWKTGLCRLSTKLRSWERCCAVLASRAGFSGRVRDIPPPG
jgi:hypothetical protein